MTSLNFFCTLLLSTRLSRTNFVRLQRYTSICLIVLTSFLLQSLALLASTHEVVHLLLKTLCCIPNQSLNATQYETKSSLPYTDVWLPDKVKCSHILAGKMMVSCEVFCCIYFSVQRHLHLFGMETTANPISAVVKFLSHNMSAAPEPLHTKLYLSSCLPAEQVAAVACL